MNFLGIKADLDLIFKGEYKKVNFQIKFSEK